MFTKISITFLLSILALLPGAAQDWLGQTRADIRTGITGKGTAAKVLDETDTTLTLRCEEEDERCRKFDVRYEFSFAADACTAYRRILPLHSYWAITMQDLIAQEEGTPSGEDLDIDGETLASDYDFEDFTLHFSVENGCLIAEFRRKE